MDEAVFEVRDKIRSGADRALEAGQPFLGHAASEERLIEPIRITIAAQESQVSLADHDVVGRGVVVQFLVPFLQEPAGHFLDVVAVHDLQNLIPDALAFAAAAHASQHEPDQVPALRLPGERGGEFQGEAVLGVSQFAGFGVEIALPIKLADGGEAKPDEQGRPALPLPADLVDEIVAKVEAVHQRPAMLAHLALHDLLCQRGQSGRRFGPWGNRNIQVLATTFQPLARRGLVKEEADSGRGIGVMELELEPTQLLPLIERRLDRMVVESDSAGRTPLGSGWPPLRPRALRHAPMQDQRAGRVSQQQNLVMVAAPGDGDGQLFPGVKRKDLSVQNLRALNLAVQHRRGLRSVGHEFRQ